MPVQKLETVDAFVVRDFPEAPSSGLVRRGRKILQRSATDLARSATYAFAFHGLQRSGASAGLNAEGDEAGPALVAFLSELHDELAGGELELLPAKGIAADEFADATAAAPADDAPDETDLDVLLTDGVMAATSWALGGSIDGRRIFVEGDPTDPTHKSLTAALSAAGAVTVEPKVVDGKPWTLWATEAEVLLVGSRPGVMTHQGAELLGVKAVIPWGPLPITTKALAVMIGRNIVYVPDFVSAAGPIVARHLTGDGARPAQPLAAGIIDGLNALDHETDPLFIAACHRAEAFLATWQEKLPFGRPLAG